MFKRFAFFVAVMCVTIALADVGVSVSGVVKDASGNARQGAFVALVHGGLWDTTDVNGAFSISGTVHIRHLMPEVTQSLAGKPFLKGQNLFFSVASKQRVQVALFDVMGKQIARILDQGLGQGMYSVDPFAYLGRQLPAAMYVLKVRVGQQMTPLSILHTGRHYLTNSPIATSSATEYNLAKTVSTVVDSLEVSSCGHLVNRVALSSYTVSGLNIVLSDTTVGLGDNATVDSLFEELLEMIAGLDSVDSADEVKSKDFASIRDGFQEVLDTQNPFILKANLGQIVASLFALNTSDKIWKLVDSLDAYIEAMEDDDPATSPAMTPTPSPAAEGMMKKTLANHGVMGLGKAMAVKTPQIVMAQTQQQDPTFPKFITVSYIQDVIETEFMPVLNSAVLSTKRMEACDGISLLLDIEEDTFEIDKGEIFAFDAGLHLLRAYLGMYLLYNGDMYAPNTSNNSWIDTMAQNDQDDKTIITLKGDTLVKTGYEETYTDLFMARTIKYNMQSNQNFMTIRKNGHAAVKQDLLAVPLLLKAGIAHVRAESGDQTYDIIKIADITDADSGLIDFTQDLKDEGISDSLAEKFQSPEAIADFVTQLLSGPYRFQETVDSVDIDITVDLSAFFDDPVEDLRSIMPKYTWLPESMWVHTQIDTYQMGSVSYNSFYFYQGDSVAIDSAAHIDSIVSSTGGSKVCYLKPNTLSYELYLDSLVDILPIKLVDSLGTAMEWETVDSLIEAEAFLPYFDDYTFNGIFPDMTRQKWFDLIYQ
ncbi:MAG: hypothetical protein GF398_16570 [Chitinivibrionales bacterium]|nr:hypothetical protein [Chitinivibrionales bacterium]